MMQRSYTQDDREVFVTYVLAYEFKFVDQVCICTSYFF